MARPRNNVSRLPAEARWRVCCMLDDGATYDEIRQDPDVAAAITETGLELHNSSLLAFRESLEFREWSERRRKSEDEIIKVRVAAEWARRGTDGVIDVVAYELARRAMDDLDAGKSLEPKDLAAMARACQSLSSRSWLRREAEMSEKVASLSKSLAEMSAKAAEAGTRNAGLTEEGIRKIEEAAKLL